MRKTNKQTYEMDGKQVEIDLSGEEGKLLADLLKGGKRGSSKRVTSKRRGSSRRTSKSRSSSKKNK